MVYTRLGLSPRCDGAELDELDVPAGRALWMQTGTKKKRKKKKKGTTTTPAPAQPTAPTPAKDVDEVTGRTASRIVRKEKYRLVGQKTWAFSRDLHFGYDDLHSCVPAPDLRTLLHMLKSQDKVLKKAKNRRRPSDMIHYLGDTLQENFVAGRAEDEDVRYQLYSLRPQLVSDGPDASFTTLLSPPNQKGERFSRKYFARNTGEIVDCPGNLYPSFRRHSDRTGVDLLNPAGLVLNLGNKLVWKRENERFYAQKRQDEDFDAFADLDPGVRLSYEAIELLVYRFFTETETETPAKPSKGKSPPPDPPLYAEIDVYLSNAANRNRTAPALSPTPPSRPLRRPPPRDPPSPPDDKPTPSASNNSSTRSAAPFPPQPVFSPPTTRSRSEQRRDRAWLETSLSTLRVATVSLISPLSSEHYTLRELPFSALASVVHSSGQPFDATSSRDRVLASLVPLHKPRNSGLKTVTSVAAVQIWADSDSTSFSPLEELERIKTIHRAGRLHSFIFAIEETPRNGDSASPTSASAVIVCLADPTPAHVPCLRDIAASLWLERPKFTERDRRAGFAWRPRHREDAEAALAAVDTELRQELLFSPIIDWKYRQTLMRGSLFAGEQDILLYGSIPPLLSPSPPLPPSLLSARPAASSTKVPMPPVEQRPLTDRNSDRASGIASRHVSALQENEPPLPPGSPRRTALNRPATTTKTLRTMR
ncbi:hypothetical protein Rt10032_c06g2982 [Rhodotorula toruloides]|uniref:Uncharacterized protein n=1 Tax=Rhodotorula toruloides TaxID=5286 RepID=A0A511KGD0_RHOTO|nr:hypothetical protein Rt10032_c06g2982 [Rhodotorula toruloides]